MENKKPMTIDELRKKISGIMKTIVKIKPSFLDKVAVWIASHVAARTFPDYFYIDGYLSGLEHICTERCQV